MGNDRFYWVDMTEAAEPGKFVNGYCLNCPDERCLYCNVVAEGPLPEHIVVPVREIRDRRYYAEVLRALAPIFRSDLIALWRSAGLTGFRTVPVQLVHNKNFRSLRIPVPDYFYMVVEGRARLLKPPIKFTCPVCGFNKYDFDRRTGIQVDTSTWDGMDFFRPTFYTGVVLCTERAARVTLEAGYCNAVAFVKTEEYGTWEPFTARTWTAAAYDIMREQYLIRDPSRL